MSGPDTETDTGDSGETAEIGGRDGRRVADLPEATIVGRAQDGDLAAFEELNRRYQGPLYRLAVRLLADRGEAEDALQDTMVAVWRKLPSLTDLPAFHGWVYQIMTRRCMSVLRTRARRSTDPVDADAMVEVAGDGAVLVTGSGSPDPAAATEYAEQLRGLNEELAKLPDEQRVCWVLKEFHELSYPEIAYAMNLPVSTVRGRIARARQNLARGMEAWR